MLFWRMLFGIFAIIGSLNAQVYYPFDPVTEIDHYNVFAFRITDDFVLDTTGWKRLILPDTIEVHFEQPKRKSNVFQDKPYFCPHSDTIFAVVENDSSIYKYISSGDDSAVFAMVEMDGFRSGLWEFSVTCVDTFGNISQYSLPYNAVIDEELYLLSPVNFKLIIKR